MSRDSVEDESDREAASVPYLIAVGELVQAWNYLQENLADLFLRASGVRDGDVGYAIWHSTSNDHAQRSMLRAAVEISFASDEKLRTEIIWLLDRIDNSLRHKRNAAVHAPVILSRDRGKEITILPMDDTNNPRASSFEGKEIIKEIIWYAETATALRMYCFSLLCYLFSPPSPLPQRPILPHLGQQGTSRGKPRVKSQK